MTQHNSAGSTQAEIFMRRAIELSRTGMTAGDGGPFGAVVVNENKIIGEGWNRVIATNDPTAHGEIVAIRNACARLGTFDLTGCEIYTTGEPCPMCLAAIYWARIGKVFYSFGIHDAAALGFDDSHFYKQLAKPWEEREVEGIQLLKEEALNVVRGYLHLPSRQPY